MKKSKEFFFKRNEKTKNFKSEIISAEEALPQRIASPMNNIQRICILIRAIIIRTRIV